MSCFASFPVDEELLCFSFSAVEIVALLGDRDECRCEILALSIAELIAMSPLDNNVG